MNTATAADYGWIRSSSSLFMFALEAGYTMTLVRGVLPEEVFRLARAEPGEVCQGLHALIQRHLELLDESDDWPESFLTGAFTVPGPRPDWTVILEFGGELGMRSGFMEPLSNGTRAVSHSSNGGKPMDFFHWYENGELRTTFEWPGDRTGRTPDDLNPLMREVGLDPSGDEDPEVDRKAAVLALTERLTGVRLTEDLLRDAEYLTAEVPEEPSEEWPAVVDITNTCGEQTYVERREDQF
ncbi:DUF6461 domain-containing protein [Streptomyces sp. NBC_00091]|uniref:DUF6461 domain-containing protein n=1 Tax=Streptomyces sp. NBC_00091 TaxID=2975648 RepID=UPI0022562C24|nr:DUF6461 domain-containing protein [Streptomyces sp. NBC_00091]MCX5380427.1 DUF6461 domain-containing protein [Streptomyces sp. NBC_00091]